MKKRKSPEKKKELDAIIKKLARLEKDLKVLKNKEAENIKILALLKRAKKGSIIVSEDDLKMLRRNGIKPKILRKIK